jgi:hypothetical protein
MNSAYIATRALMRFARVTTKDRTSPVLRISTSAGRSNFSTSLRIMANDSGRCLFITSEMRPLLPITSWADGVMLGLIVVNQNCQNLKSVPFRAACCGIQAAVDVLKGKLVIGFVVNGFDGLHGVSQTIEASILSYSAWLWADPD